MLEQPLGMRLSKAARDLVAQVWVHLERAPEGGLGGIRWRVVDEGADPGVRDRPDCELLDGDLELVSRLEGEAITDEPESENNRFSLPMKMRVACASRAASSTRAIASAPSNSSNN